MIDFLHEGQCLLDDMRCRCMGKETALHEQVREIHHLLDAHVKGCENRAEDATPGQGLVFRCFCFLPFYTIRSDVLAKGYL